MLRTASPPQKEGAGETVHASAPSLDGARGFDPTDPPQLAPSQPVAAAVRVAIAEGRYLLELNTPKACEGVPEGVHQLRTTTRRLRTALVLFESVVEPEWAERLANELKWLSRQLGEVRDLDVLTGRLHAHAKELDGDTLQTLDLLFDELRGRHCTASQALQEALQSERFTRLTAELARADGTIPLTDAAAQPCRKVLPRLVAEAWKDLKREGRALDPEASDEAFHAVRKLAKRARYAAEAVRHALAHSEAQAARRFARRARTVQDVLGTHQDAVVASALLQQAAAAHPGLGPFNFAAGRLIEVEKHLADDSRTRFFKVWDELDRKKLVRWLKG